MEICNLYKLIPEFELIADQDLREKAAKAMIMAIDEGGWTEETVNKCPISLEAVYEKCPLKFVDYTRMMAQVSDVFNKSYGEWINSMNPFNADYVIAGALLQGIGKLYEYTIGGDGVACRSESGKLFRYPWRGAYVVKECDLPLEVVHIVVSINSKYSPGKGKVIKTPESVIVRNADLICSGIIEKRYA